MTYWIVELEGKRMFFSSPERAEEFARTYRELHGVDVAVREMEE